MDNHIATNLDDLIMIVKAIMEKNRTSGNPVKIWDGRVLPIKEFKLSNWLYSSRETVDGERLRHCLVELLVNEKPFEFHIRKKNQEYVIKWSFEVSFGDIRNFIENIIIVNVYNRRGISDAKFRTLVKETLPDRFKSSTIDNPVMNIITMDLYNTNVPDGKIRLALEGALSTLR